MRIKNRNTASQIKIEFDMWMQHFVEYNPTRQYSCLVVVVVVVTYVSST